MTKLQEYKDAFARQAEAARRLHISASMLGRDNLSPAERREMAEVAAEYKAAGRALDKAEIAFKASLRGSSP